MASEQSSGGTEHTVVDEFGLDDPDWNVGWNGVPRPGEGFVCMVAEALEPGDEVIINGRSRPLTVLGFEEQASPGVVQQRDYPYYIQWLRGNGTEYRLRWSHLAEYYPNLHTESELETRESYSVKHGEPRKHTTATTRGKRVAWICPVDVDRKDLSEWAFLRNVEGLSDSDVDPATDHGGDGR